MPTLQIDFPTDRDFAEFRAWVAQNYHEGEAKAERRQVRKDGTSAVLTARDDLIGPLSAVAFRRHRGVIV